MKDLDFVREKIQRNIWRFSVPLYAHRISKGQYFPYDYLMKIATKIQILLLRRDARIIVCMPPRRGKTTLITQWTPTWWIDTFPKEEIIITSCEATAAIEWNRQIRDNLRDNPNAMTTVRQDVSSARAWKTVHGGGSQAAGVGGRIIGSGGHLLILDDPYKNWVQAFSETYSRTLISWFDSVFYSRLEPGGSIVVVTTRWNSHDIVAYLTETHQDDWILLNYPLVAGEDDLLGRKPGETFLTGRYTWADVERLKRVVPPVIFAAMYQQEPMDEQSHIFFDDWFQSWTLSGVGETRKLPDVFDEVILSGDMNFKETSDGSYVCVTKWGRLGADFYLLDLIRGRWGFIDTLEAFVEFIQKHPDALSIVIEEAANGAAVMDVLRRRVPGVRAFNPRGSKQARAIAISSFFKSGNVFIPKNEQCSWVREYREELLRFPGRDQNNDQVDSTSQALLFLNRNMREQIMTRETIDLPTLERPPEWNLNMVGDLCNL